MRKEKLYGFTFKRQSPVYPNACDIAQTLCDLGISKGFNGNFKALVSAFLLDTDYPMMMPYESKSDYDKTFALAFAKWIYENYDIGDVE